MIEQPDSIWLREDQYSEQTKVVYKEDKILELSQYATLPAQSISGLKIKVISGEDVDLSNVQLQIIDPSNDKIIASCYGERSSQREDEIVFNFKITKVSKNKQYEFKIKSKNKDIGFTYMKTPTNNYQLEAIQQNYETDFFYIDKDIVSGYYLSMQVLGNK